MQCADRPGFARLMLGRGGGSGLARLRGRRFRRLVEEMPVASYISAPDATSRALYVSPGIVSLLGYELHEWRARPWLFEELLHSDDRAGVLAAIERAKRTGEPFEDEYRLVHRDGTIVWVQDKAVTIRDRRGRPIHWQGFLVDVTARRSAEARYRALVETLPLITYVDHATRAGVTPYYISPQVEELLGYTAAEWTAEPGFFARHLHPDDRERVLAAQRAARERGVATTVEYRFLAKDGRSVWLQDSFTMIRDEAGGPSYGQGFAVDITERKHAERERELMLEREQQQNEELRRIDQVKDEFIATVSHELRTPLTSIRGYVELLLDDPAFGELTAKQRELLGVVERNSDRVAALVEDLLLTAQARAGRLQLVKATVDLAALVAQGARAAGPAADAGGIELVADAPRPVLVDADPLRIGQVIDNLLANAVKFTPVGGRIDIRATATRDHATIEIVDTGVGIPLDEQQHLFDPFFRAEHARDHAIIGAGLGLAITKMLVEAHGGHISFTSGTGQGTTFRVRLPATDETVFSAL
jgi:PAS domain S-box-containing protein